MMKFFRRILWGCESLTRTFVCREEAAAKSLQQAKKAENTPEADQDVADETQKSARKFSQKLCEIRERVRLLVNLSEIRGVLKLRVDLREIRERVRLRGMLRKAKGIYYIGAEHAD